MQRNRSRERSPPDRERRMYLPGSTIVRNSFSSGKYQYKPLNQSANEIRLIQLVSDDPLPEQWYSLEANQTTFHMFEVALDQAPEYEALSYAWGEASELANIGLDGFTFVIRRNLERALFQLQRTATSTSLFWVDSICIDQTNEKERSEQVAKMRSIYARASGVHVWLGESFRNSGQAFSLLHELHGYRDNEEKLREMLQSLQNHQRLQALSSLFSREYWWRVWVIQEVNFAKRITVHCGRSTMLWNDMLAVQNALREKFDILLDNLSVTHRSLRKLHQSIWFRGPHSLLLDRAGTSSDPLVVDLFDALMMHRLKHSTDPRDKVYALVGLTAARDDPEFVIDYSLSVPQVYTNTADNILRRSLSLDFMCAKTRGREKHDLPSWVSNWASTGSGCPVPYRHASKRSAYKASGTRNAIAHISCENGIIKAEGILISSLKTVGQLSDIEDMGDHRNTVTSINAWHTLVTANLEINHEKNEEFSRLLLNETIKRESFVGYTLSGILQSYLGSIAEYSRQMYPGIQLNPLLVELADSMTGPERPFNQLSELQLLSQILFMRRLFITAEGGVGLAEEMIIEGDIVCILFGCSIPVILRPVGDHYIYISDACVVGYMFGKGVEELEEGKRTTQLFEIH